MADLIPPHRHGPSRDLCGRAIDAGWSVAWKPQVDTGNNPFIVVEGIREGGWFSATWHTRDAGSYRYWSGSLGSRYNPKPASLKKLLAYVEGESL